MSNQIVSYGSSKPKKSQAEGGKRYLSRNDLVARGINYSDSHLRRMCADGRFPKPLKLSPRKNAWEEGVIDKWLADKATKST